MFIHAIIFFLSLIGGFYAEKKEEKYLSIASLYVFTGNILIFLINIYM